MGTLTTILPDTDRTDHPALRQQRDPIREGRQAAPAPTPSAQRTTRARVDHLPSRGAQLETAPPLPPFSGELLAADEITDHWIPGREPQREPTARLEPETKLAAGMLHPDVVTGSEAPSDGEKRREQADRRYGDPVQDGGLT